MTCAGFCQPSGFHRPTAAELAERIKTLRGTHQVGVVPVKPVRVEEPKHEPAPPKAEESLDDKPAISFRAKVKPTGTQPRLF